jgi:hypothetical protein
VKVVLLTSFPLQKKVVEEALHCAQVIKVTGCPQSGMLLLLCMHAQLHVLLLQKDLVGSPPMEMEIWVPRSEGRECALYQLSSYPTACNCLCDLFLCCTAASLNTY